MTMPNFFLVGTQKAGTSSLYSYLQQHPQIYMSPVKEPFFFMTRGMENATSATINDLDSYLDLFAGVTDETAVGEASSNYLACPWSPALIKETIPNAKIVAILRNPIDRAWSHYLMHAAKGYPMFSSDFSEAIKETHTYVREGQYWEFGYISMGRYSEQLERYYSFFSQQQLLVLLYDDFSKDPGKALCKVFAFLGVDDSIKCDTGRKHNVSRLSRSKKIDTFLRGQGVIKSIFRNFLPQSLRISAKSALSSMNSYKPSLDQRTKDRLQDIYRDEITYLQQLLGRDLSHWLG